MCVIHRLSEPVERPWLADRTLPASIEPIAWRNRMLRKLLVLVALVALALPAGTLAAPEKATSATGYAIVTLADAPLATYEGGTNGLERTKPIRGRLDPTSPAYRAYERFLANERANYRAHLAQRVPQAQIVAEYDTVLNGFAIKLNGASLASLANHPKVKAVDGSWLYRPTMNVSVDLISAPAVWASLGGQEEAGEDIAVGIIDTGIRDDHPFFACKDEIPHKVFAAGVAGTGDDIVFNHGTHVAGTVGGCVTTLTEGPLQDTVSGVAPGVNLFDYNVFPGYGGGFVAFGGSAFSHDIALALEEAVNDEMDVVNLSLGGSIQGEHDFLAEAINATAAAGVVPAVAAGNSGPGDSTVESPGNAFGALTAGASTNPHFIGISVAVEGGDTIGAALGDFANFDPPITAEYTVTEPAFGCSAITNDVAGKIALIDRGPTPGACSFTTKVRNAEAAGAIGVLIVNNVAGDPTAPGADGTTPEPTIPAAMVGKDEGAAIKPSGTVTVDGTNPQEVVTANADIIAGFSSRGPAGFTENIKPDVTAPGVNVFSSVFDEETGDLGWAMFSGTSMATPHVAGSAALLLDQNPDLTPADVKSLLGNNADRTVTDHVSGTTDPGVMARGGGRINLERASAATATFDPMSLSFGVSNGNRPVNETISVTVRNLSGSATNLMISGGTSDMSYPANVAVPANGTATFEVSLSTRGPAEAEGDLTVTDGSETFLIPFWYSNGN
jgi:minor extracellular serine protease Vpr